jgi:type I restriction enzyme R subunit
MHSVLIITMESERQTRKKPIDPMLTSCGWTVVPFDPAKSFSAYANHAVEEYPTENGPTDYALIVGGQILGVVEAKKLTLGSQGVLPQAERYSKGVKSSASCISRRRVSSLKPRTSRS